MVTTPIHLLLMATYSWSPSWPVGAHPSVVHHSSDIISGGGQVTQSEILFSAYKTAYWGNKERVLILNHTFCTGCV